MPPENFGLLKREEKRGNFKVYTAEARPGTNFISFNLNKGRRNGRPLIDPLSLAGSIRWNSDKLLLMLSIAKT
jgi:hypothetical protein